MTQTLTRTLGKIEQAGAASSLLSVRRGLEKESLRVNQAGIISQRPHPSHLGSTLTHPYITTDYSEALIELITPPHLDAETLLQDMTDIHQFTYRNLGDELLWVNSMPCILHGEDSISIANYGTSNVGRMKTIYRIGLAHRYGKLMQTIAGIHFNFSIGDDFWHSWRTICGSTVPLRDFKSEGYFGLVRNVYRYGWLIPYLFGASPAVCQTFLDGRDHHLKLLGESSYYLPYATSLRLSDLGYQSDAQAAIRVNLDSTDAYIESLTRATTESYSPYEAIGLQVDGDYKQLNTSLLQIDNEYYAPIRPKRTIQTGEKPTYALRKRGVEYVELRSIDLNPFLPIGIDRSQILFLDIFLLYCLLLDSPPMSEAEQQNCHTTLKQVVERGRDPDLFLTIGNQKLTKLSSSLMSHFKILAEFLDQHGGKDYSSTVRKQQDKFNDSSLTPSAQVLEAMQKYDDNFFNFALAQAVRTGEYFENLDLPAEQLLQMSQDAMDSIDRQRAMEQTDRIGFAEFLERYFNQ